MKNLYFLKIIRTLFKAIPWHIKFILLGIALVIFPPSGITHKYPLAEAENKVFISKKNFFYLRAFNPDNPREIILSNGFFLLNDFIERSLRTDGHLGTLGGAFDHIYYPMRIEFVPKGTHFHVVDKYFPYGSGIFSIREPNLDHNCSFVLEDENGVKSELKDTLSFWDLYEERNEDKFYVDLQQVSEEFKFKKSITRDFLKDPSKIIAAKVLIKYMEFTKDELEFKEKTHGYSIEFKSINSFLTYYYFLENFEDDTLRILKERNFPLKSRMGRGISNFHILIDDLLSLNKEKSSH